jgi:hypothetical protein
VFIALAERTHPRLRSIHHNDHSREAPPMTTIGYDAPRRSIVELEEGSIEELQARPVSAQSRWSTSTNSTPSRALNCPAWT